MARVIYIVARQQPMLRGYLMARVGARSPEGHPVEIKWDERRGERRQQDGPRDPERRRGDRRLRPSLDRDLRSRGYARLVQSETQSETTQSRLGRGTAEAAPGWRPRSTWRDRGARVLGRRLRRVSGRFTTVWRRIRQALPVGLLIALGAGLLWLSREPTLTPGAVRRSALWGGVALLVWGMTSPWWRDETHPRKRRRGP